MFDFSSIQRSYSSKVKMQLIVDGTSYKIGKVWRNELYMQNPIELDPCDAELVIQIDDAVYRRKVRLENGAVPVDHKVVVTPLDSLLLSE